MTDKELITKLQSLKTITPRKDWAFSVKMQVLKLDKVAVKTVTGEPVYQQAISTVLHLLNRGKFAYVFGALLFIISGMFGFAQYTLPGDALFEVKKMTEISQASLTGESQVKSNIETFKKRSQDLAQVMKENKVGNEVAAKKEMNEAAKMLTETIINDPSAVQEIALELKNNRTLATLGASVEVGTEGVEGVKEMYKTLVEQLIKDEEAVMFTEDQLKIFEEVKSLFEKENYIEAFEKNFELNLDTKVIEEK